MLKIQTSRSVFLILYTTLSVCGGSSRSGEIAAVASSSEISDQNKAIANNCAMTVAASEPMPTLLQNTPADCDYYLESGGIVENLSIEAGTFILMGEFASLEIRGNDISTLQAIGTALEPITIKGLTNEPGYWHGIDAHQATVNLEHVTIDGAGGVSEIGAPSEFALNLYESDLSLDHAAITNSLTGGLGLNRSNITQFGNNVFAGNGHSGLTLIFPASDSIIDFLDVNTDYSGVQSPNGDNFVNILPSNFVTRSFNGTLRNINATYRIGDLRSDRLIIEAGVNIALEERAEWRIEGTLEAIGTEDDVISISAVPGFEGSFANIELSDTSSMSHVSIMGGGFGATLGAETGALVMSANTQLSNVSISNSTGWGISCGLFPTTIRLNNVTFDSNELGEVDPGCTVLD